MIQKGILPTMPHPKRNEANGHPVYSVFINLWADDVSGNVSKQYNKHINVCMTNACLPGHLLQKDHFVKFVSTSQHASTLEQLEMIKTQIRCVSLKQKQFF